MRQLLYGISHATTYQYLGNVSLSHHLLRLAPRNFSKQQRLTHDLVIDPEPVTLTSHGDYFGNLAHFITVERSHRQLAVTSRCQVVISPALIPDPTETPTWENVRGLCATDRSRHVLEAHEFTHPSPLIKSAPEYADYGKTSFPKDRPILDGVVDLTRRIYTDFKFDPQATTVTTPVADVFKHRRGVCQDFAHIEIACLRALGLPARYVSGYLETDPPPGHAKLRGADASHAWISFFCPGIGWIDADPTNNCLPSLRHITVAWGRDYEDVCPLRGVLLGGEDQTLMVSVDVVAQGSFEASDTKNPEFIY